MVILDYENENLRYNVLGKNALGKKGYKDNWLM
jgi:hypothetical protein